MTAAIGLILRHLVVKGAFTILLITRRCEYQICSAARSARGPALTDHVSTLDASTQANGQNPEGLFINGAH